MACGDFKHPLQRGGTSANDRFLPGLEPGYALVDEKDLADWIVYAENLSAFVKFYNEANTTTENWTPFFSTDISATLAFVAAQDPDGLGGVSTRFTILRDDGNQGDAALLKKTLGELFGAALTFAASLDDLSARLPESSPLKPVLASLIKTKLAATIQRLISYYKAAAGANLVTIANVPEWKILGRPVTDAASISLSKDWITNGAASWNLYYNGINADPGIFGNGPTPAQKVRHAANHNLFSSLFDQLFAGYARVLKEAADGLKETLDDWQEHPPHYTLFLTFLKLLKLVQSELNKFTTRHLDFYYQDVLQLRPKRPSPDSAYITIELAKQVANYMLPAGTRFRGGKDGIGQDVYYALQKDVVFNKARVGKLMSVYRGAGKDDIDLTVNEDRWFAASVSNSADGAGATLSSPQGEWHPYVNRTYVDGSLESINEPRAQIGFAIASHYLALAEGTRIVTVRIATSNNATLSGKHFDVFLTTAKSWTQAAAPEISTGTMTDGTACAVLIISLDPTVEAITDYNAEVHGGTFGVAVPILKLVLQNVPEVGYEYQALKDVTIAKVELEVGVGTESIGAYSAQGVRQVSLASSAGTIDPAKAFLPFGAQPESDASFILGSKEIFSKRGVTVRFTADWINLPEDAVDIAYDADEEDTTPVASLDFLEAGSWKDSDLNLELFDGTTQIVSFPDSPVQIPDDAITSYSEPFEIYSNLSRGGFLRFRLDQGFGHKDYFSQLTKYLIEQAKPEPDATVTKPDEPYNPTLQSLTVSYTASCVVDLASPDVETFEDRPLKFFHVYAFGEAEQHVQLFNAASIYFLPQFRYIETPADTGSSSSTTLILENQAEFYVGLESIAAGESVSILFQFLEGTTDPQVLKPDEHLYFSYLSDNTWKAIRRDVVGDSTRQFIQSGLIELAIPADATTTNTLLPSGYIWLRFSVAEAPDAIAKLLNVLPQSALVTYQADPLNAPDFPTEPLPAGTISKLKEPNSAIKKIQQLYSSFRIGGGGETGRLFNARVSERLRHKDRAITIWDYEHLVLQAFSDIHKVKCLSHTTLIEDPDDPDKLICNEMAPGHVLVITIPNLANRNDANPLRPYTNASLIVEIQEFLRKRVTCHANVLVANPLFEGVRMEFIVTLRKGYNDAAFYHTLLQNEITEFLTPWAFSQGVDIQFGGKIFKSSLIDFIEERDYVDFLTDVKLFHKPGDDAIESQDLDEAVASTARSILVSAPASKHAITVLLHEEADSLEEECCVDE
jgi:hypothetical protein